MRRVGLVILFLAASWAVWLAYNRDRNLDDDVAANSGRSGGGASILRRGNGPEPQSLDPHVAQTDSGQTVVRDLFEGLMSLAPDGSVVPGAAHTWGISDDGKTYTFYIRDDARWSDGSPVVAQDFVFAFRRLVTPETASPYSQILAQVTNARDVIAGRQEPETLGVSATNDHTLEVQLHAPTPYFLGLLANSSTSPLHRESVKTLGPDFMRPGNLVSNGAYVLEEWLVGSHISAKRNPYYWDASNVAVEQIFFYHIVDETSELQRYRAGDLDITYTIPMPRTAWLKQNMPDELKISPFLGTYYYALNVTRPPFSGAAELRAALSLAIDRDFITEKITAAGQVPAYGWIPPGVDNYDSQSLDFADWSTEDRLQKARALYEQAGYSREQPLEVEIRYNTGEGHQQIAAAIAAMWKETLGVRSRLVNEEFRVLLQNARQRAITEIVRSSWLGDYNDANTFAEILRSDHGINYAGYASDDYDALLDAASAESDLAKRKALLEQAERHMLADHPIIPLYFYVSRHLVQPYVTGWQGNVMDYHYGKHLGLAE